MDSAPAPRPRTATSRRTSLRGEWDVTGDVQSGFCSTRSSAASPQAGLDLEMPDGKWLSREYVTAELKDTSVQIEAVAAAQDADTVVLLKDSNPYSCRGSTRCPPCSRRGARGPRTDTSWPICSSAW
jgi:hypothetical protein